MQALYERIDIRLVHGVGFLLIIAVIVGFFLPRAARVTVPTIASNVMKEAFRRRIIYLLPAGIILLFLAGSFLSTQVSPGDEDKMVKDSAMASLFVMTILLGIFLSVQLIPTEVERRTVYIILSKPVKRYHFVAGKFLGVLGVIGLMTLVTGAVLIGLVYLRTQVWAPEMIFAMFSAVVISAVLSALVITTSTVSSMMLTVFVAFVLYFLGSIQSSLENIARHTEVPVQQLAIQLVSVILPNFENWDTRLRVLDEIMPPLPLLSGILLHASVYTIVVLAFGMLFFNEREV